MAQVGYIRVSSTDQNVERQLQGVELDKSFTDKASGKNTDRPGWQACREYLREGDTLHVHSIDRLGRSMSDLLRIVDELTGKGISIHFHKENLVFSAGGADPMQKLQFSMLAAFAEFERALIRERQREGIELAKAAGISPYTMTKLNNDRPVNMEVMMNFCKVFHCDIGDLMEITEED